MNPPGRDRRGVAATLATALAAAGILFWLQFSTDRLFDGDSYFHTRAAQQLAENGISKQFPQAAFSTWKERYSDKDFLFHVLLIPFCADEANLRTGGKWAAAVFGLLALGSFALAIGGLRIRFGPVWILLLVSTSVWLLRHMLKTRPHLLAMCLFPLEVLCLLTARHKSLAALAALHTLGHTSFVLLPVLPLAQLLALRLRGVSASWGALAAVVVGIAAATLLHPYFPNNLTLTFDQVAEVARSVWLPRPDVPAYLFGGELVPLGAGAFWRFFPSWLPLVVGVVAALASGSAGRLSDRSLTLCWIAAVFLLLTLLSLRFLAFSAGMGLLAAGSVWTDLAGSRSWRELVRPGSLASWAGIAFLASCLVAGQWLNHPLQIPAQLEKVRAVDSYRPAIAYLDRAAKPDDQVYHGFWWPFAWLYHFRPDGRYVVGLDSIFLYRFDPRLFRGMLDVYQGTADHPYAVIRGEFGARWVFVEKTQRTRAFRERLAGEPFIVPRYGDAFAEVYEVLGPNRDPSSRAAGPAGDRVRR